MAGTPQKEQGLYGPAYAEAQSRQIPEPYVLMLKPYCVSARSVLDIGSGNGSLLKGMRTINPEINTIAADLNYFINRKAYDRGTPAITVDARKELPFSDNQFDLITSVLAPEHFITTDNAEEIMKEFGRITALNGHVALVFPCPWLVPQEGAFIDGWNLHRSESLPYRLMHAWQDASELHPKALQPKTIHDASNKAGLLLEDCRLLFVPKEMGRSWWMVFKKK